MVLYVEPSSAAAEARRDSLLSEGLLSQGSSVLFGARVFAAAHFEQWLVERMLPEQRVWTALERQAVAASVVRELDEHAGPGLACALERSLGTFRLSNLKRSDLRQHLAGSDDIGEAQRSRMSFLLDAVGLFEDRMVQDRAVDHAGGLQRVIARLREGAPLPFSDVEIRVSGELDWPELRLQLFEALALRSLKGGTVQLRLPHAVWDGTGPAPAAYGWFDRSARVLSQLEQRLDTPIDVFPEMPEPPLLGDRVPSSARSPLALFLAGKGASGVEARVGRSRRIELQLAARWIRERLDAGCPARLALVAAPASVSPRLIARALRSAGVPVRDALHKAALDSTKVRWILRMLRINEDPSPIDALSSLLRSDFAGSLLTAYDLDKQSFGDVIDQVRISGRLPHGLTPVAQVLKQRAGALPSARGINTRRVVSLLEELSKPLRAVTEAESLREWGRAVIRLLVVFEASDEAGEPTEPAPTKALEDALVSLSRLTGRRAFQGLIPGRDAVDLIESELARTFVSVAAPESDPNGVRIVPLRDAYHTEFTCVAILGLNQGAFPTVRRDDPLFPERDQACLRPGTALASGGADPGDDELALALLLNRPATEALLLCRAQGDEGKPLGPARAFEVVQDLLPQRVPEADGLDPLTGAFGADQVVRAVVHHQNAVTAGRPIAELAKEKVTLDWLAGGDDLARRVGVERGRLIQVLAKDPAIPNEYEGNVAGLASAESFGQKERPASATALEDSALCPFKFFARHQLRLRANRAVGFDVSSLSRGTAAHACLEAALRELNRRGFSRYRRENAKEAREIALTVALKTARDRLAREPVETGVSASTARDLSARISTLVFRLFLSQDGFSPEFIEQGFGDGKPGSWPALQVSAEPPLFVRGQIDLVERKLDQVRVCDLKSSGQKSLARKLRPATFGTEQLQLGLYAVAACTSLGAESADVRYLSLADAAPAPALSDLMEKKRGAWAKDGRGIHEVLSLEDGAGGESELQRAVVEQTISIRSGRFPVAPTDDACTFCDYGALCRIPPSGPEEQG